MGFTSSVRSPKLWLHVRRCRRFRDCIQLGCGGQIHDTPVSIERTLPESSAKRLVPFQLRLVRKAMFNSGYVELYETT